MRETFSLFAHYCWFTGGGGIFIYSDGDTAACLQTDVAGGESDMRVMMEVHLFSRKYAAVP